jgi:single-stranded DNA-binding protein
MNLVVITGCIQSIKFFDKVCYIKIRVRQSSELTEWISVTCFSPDFVKKYFHDGKWISIIGHIHINNQNNEYNTEIIVDDIKFVGAKEQESNNIIPPNQTDVKFPWE